MLFMSTSLPGSLAVKVFIKILIVYPANAVALGIIFLLFMNFFIDKPGNPQIESTMFLLALGLHLVVASLYRWIFHYWPFPISVWVRFVQIKAVRKFLNLRDQEHIEVEAEKSS